MENYSEPNHHHHQHHHLPNYQVHSRKNTNITNINKQQNSNHNHPHNLTHNSSNHSKHTQKNNNTLSIILFILITPITLYFLLNLHIKNPSLTTTNQQSNFGFKFEKFQSILAGRLPLVNGPTPQLKTPIQHLPPLNILLFFSPSLQTHALDQLHSIFKTFPPYSLTIICSPLPQCPQKIGSLTFGLIDSLTVYEPPMSSDVTLILDTNLLLSLDNTWLSNAARITLSSHRIVTIAGITISSSSSQTSPPSISCSTQSGVATIALAPFIFPSRVWPRAVELKYITTSLDLALHLATHLDWSSVVIPLENLVSHSVSEICHHSIEQLNEIRRQSLNKSPENTWSKHLDPKVGIIVTQAQLNLSNWFILTCQLVQKFNAQIYFLQENFKTLDAPEKSTIQKTIQNSCARKIQINFVTPVKSIQYFQSQFQAAIHQIIENQNSLELIFHLAGQDELFLPHSFKTTRPHPRQSSSINKAFDTFGTNGSSQSENETVEECVLISLPVQEISTSDWVLGLDLQALKNWHQPQIDISVITNDRSESLKRLLNSLERAAYYGDKVNIVINLEQTSDQKTRRLVEKFQWKFGSKTIKKRIIQGGLLPAVVESWYPSSAHNSYGVLLEDDVEVSGYFYGWLKFSLLHYRYSGTVHDQIYGISLYQPQHNELKPEGRRPFNASQLLANLGVEPLTMPYGSQVPCSWGALFFPEPWVEFQKYLTFRLADRLNGVKLEDPVIPSPIRSDRWSKSWKKYMIEWVYLRGLIMIYPNYHERLKVVNLDQTVSNQVGNLLIPTGLSTNHLELGTHVRNRGLRKAQDRKQIRIAKWDDSEDQLLNIDPSKAAMNKLEKLKKEFKIALKKLDKSSSLLDGLAISHSDHSNIKLKSEGEMKVMTMKKLPNLNRLVIVDLWGEVSNLIEIKYRGLMGALSSSICDKFEGLVHLDRNRSRLRPVGFNGITPPLSASFPSEYLELLSNICQ